MFKAILLTSSIFLSALFATPALATEVNPVLYGATPNDGQDDSASLQATLDVLQPGDTVVFPPGTYHTNKQLFISGKSGVTVDGRGATLVSTDPTKSAITVQDSSNVTIKSLDLQGSGTARLTADKTCGILVYRTTGLQILSNRIHGHAGAGIMLQTTSDFTLQGNVVFDTLADAIHLTNRTHDGVVQFNTTFGSGDDGIALVGYVKNGGRLHDIQILGNNVLGNHWGRGITIEGVFDTTVDRNYVENTSAAGIILSSNASYNQYGVDNVTLSNNTIKGANFGTPVHGAILLSARAGSALEDGVVVPFTITNVTIVGNTIIDTVGAGAHVRVSNYSTGISLTGNNFVDQDGSHSPWTFYGGSSVYQSGNSYNGTVLP